MGDTQRYFRDQFYRDLLSRADELAATAQRVRAALKRDTSDAAVLADRIYAALENRT